MRVLMIVPDSQMIDRRVLQTARTIVRQGHRIVLLAGFECAANESYELDGFEVHRFAFDWDDDRLKAIRDRLPRWERLQNAVNRSFMWTAWRFLRWNPFDRFVLRQCREVEADVVHVHDLPLLRHAAQVARERGIPLVYDAHEIYYEQDVLPEKTRKRLRREEIRHIPETSVFTTVNDGLADYFEALHGRRPTVVMNAVEPQPVDESDRTLLHEAAGLPLDTKIVLFQGAISPERNLVTLVRAAEHLAADTALVLIGYGDHRRELEAIAEASPARDRIRFLGRIEPENLPRYSIGADLGVIPYLPIDANHEFCSPNKFFEFVQAGVPILAHQLRFFETMGERHGVCVTGDLSDPESAGQSIRDVLGDEIRMERMRRACAVAAPKLSWNVEGARILAAYEAAGLLVAGSSPQVVAASRIPA